MKAPFRLPHAVHEVGVGLGGMESDRWASSVGMGSTSSDFGCRFARSRGGLRAGQGGTHVHARPIKSSSPWSSMSVTTMCTCASGERHAGTCAWTCTLIRTRMLFTVFGGFHVLADEDRAYLSLLWRRQPQLHHYRCWDALYYTRGAGTCGTSHLPDALAPETDQLALRLQESVRSPTRSAVSAVAASPGALAPLCRLHLGATSICSAPRCRLVL